MTIVWEHESVTADEVRRRVSADDELKDSTIRTILRRLETKGYVRHDVQGRVFVYSAVLGPANVAAEQVQGIVEKLCGGSVEELLVGMVDDAMISPKKLKQLAEKIAKAEQKQTSKQRGGRRDG